MLLLASKIVRNIGVYMADASNTSMIGMGTFLVYVIEDGLDDTARFRILVHALQIPYALVSRQIIDRYVSARLINSVLGV